MPTPNLLRGFHVPEDEILREIAAAFGPDPNDWLTADPQHFRENRLVTGRVRRVIGGEVHVDIGYKSDGILDLDEWHDESTGITTPPNPGDEIEMLLQAVEDENGAIVLSYRKAQHRAAWDRFVASHNEGDGVSGIVTRKIAGGLLVDIGVTAFLPASLIDLRRGGDVGRYVGQTINVVLLQIDRPRRNVIVSRREMLLRQRETQKRELLAVLEAGQVRRGVVKSITTYGAFVDLGGIDGLLHISDMSWKRVSDPSAVVRNDQPLEVYIMSVEKDSERIALSLKHLSPSPWAGAAEKYPVGSRHQGVVRNIMPFGAFVELEPGVEGLVPISEMSWTRRIAHPGDMVTSGETIEVQVLNVNTDRQTISLGIRQLTPNPWDDVAQRYPPGMVVRGTVRTLMNYGAFVTLEEGVDGLVHVSDMSWTRKVAHPGEMMREGDEVMCLILSVEVERRRIALGRKQLTTDPWQADIPERYRVGEVMTGKVRKVTNFGVFVELEPDLEGLLHISELGEGVVSPEGIVAIGDELTVRILRMDAGERKIALSRLGR